jgi:hypothetical protein
LNCASLPKLAFALTLSRIWSGFGLVFAPLLDSLPSLARPVSAEEQERGKRQGDQTGINHLSRIVLCEEKPGGRVVDGSLDKRGNVRNRFILQLTDLAGDAMLARSMSRASRIQDRRAAHHLETRGHPGCGGATTVKSQEFDDFPRTPPSHA